MEDEIEYGPEPYPVAVVAVVPLENYKLMVTLSNGRKGIFDVSPYLDHGIFRDLREPALFNSVRISFDTVEWANGADLCPEVVYKESVPMEAP